MTIKPETLYKISRFFIYLIPLLAIIAAGYLIFFPINVYRFYSEDPNASKFEFQKDPAKNELTFGIFTVRESRFAEVSLGLKNSNSKSCRPELVSLRKTYQAFLFPEGEEIADAGKLREILFADNKTKYPNGSLLHVKSTNQVFFISHGQKTLFPGPEIFEAFGYSFDNLTDVDSATIDEFKDADIGVFLWTIPHPDGTIFETYPSRRLFVTNNGKKYPIASEEILKGVWPDFYTIAVGDENASENLDCQPALGKFSRKFFCRFDLAQLSGIGRYHLFTAKFPSRCSVANIHPDDSQVRYISEKSLAVFKTSVRDIAASVLNRYFYKTTNVVK